MGAGNNSNTTRYALFSADEGLRIADTVRRLNAVESLIASLMHDGHRVTHQAPEEYTIKLPVSGIPAKIGNRPGAAWCKVYKLVPIAPLSLIKDLVPVLEPDGSPFRIYVTNHHDTLACGEYERASRDKYGDYAVGCTCGHCGSSSSLPPSSSSEPPSSSQRSSSSEISSSSDPSSSSSFSIPSFSSVSGCQCIWRYQSGNFPRHWKLKSGPADRCTPPPLPPQPVFTTGRGLWRVTACDETSSSGSSGESSNPSASGSNGGSGGTSGSDGGGSGSECTGCEWEWNGGDWDMIDNCCWGACDPLSKPDFDGITVGERMGGICQL